MDWPVVELSSHTRTVCFGFVAVFLWATWDWAMNNATLVHWVSSSYLCLPAIDG